MLVASGALVGAVQSQVPLVAELHLLPVHGPAYRDYPAAAGSFLPGLGRREATGSVAAAE